MPVAPKKAARSVLPESIAAEIDRLAGLPLKGLKAAWTAEFRHERPKSLWRDLLLRTWSGGSRNRPLAATIRPH